MKNPARKMIVSAAMLGIALFGAFTQTASAYELSSVSGAARTCQNGVHSVGVAYRLDGYSSGGSVIIDLDLQDPCTDGQLAVLWYRQVNIDGARGPWGTLQTGLSNQHFNRSMVRWRPLVTDVEIYVCRSGGDMACGQPRYLHV